MHADDAGAIWKSHAVAAAAQSTRTGGPSMPKASNPLDCKQAPRAQDTRTVSMLRSSFASRGVAGQPSVGTQQAQGRRCCKAPGSSKHSLHVPSTKKQILTFALRA